MRLALLVAIAACGKAPSDGVPLATLVPLVESDAPIVDVGTSAVPMIVHVHVDGSLGLARPPKTWDELATLSLDDETTVDTQTLRVNLRDRVGLDDTFDATLAHLDPTNLDGRERDQAGRPAYGIPNVASPAHARANRLRGPRQIEVSTEPERQARVVGIPDATLAWPQPAVIVADPHARATAVVDAVHATGGSLLVERSHAIRPLRFQFGSLEDASNHETITFIEIRATRAQLEIEAVPSAFTTISWDASFAARLATAVTAARERPSFELAPVDILVGPDLDMNQLATLLVALDRADVRRIGLGRIPSAGDPQLALRGPGVRKRVTLGAPNAQGDLDKAIIRRYIGRSVEKFEACYDRALAANPKLTGTVLVQFFITPNGTVASASGAGVSGEVATCFATVIHQIEFPHPKGGGGVQVNYPFDLRP